MRNETIIRLAGLRAQHLAKESPNGEFASSESAPSRPPAPEVRLTRLQARKLAEESLPPSRPPAPQRLRARKLAEESPNGEFASSESPPSRPRKKYLTLMQKYRQEIKESEGFDISRFPNVRGLPIVDQSIYLEYDSLRIMVEGHAKGALKHYSREKPGRSYWTLEKVHKVHASGCCRITFYITFSAKTISTKTQKKRSEIFQAKVETSLDGSTYPIVRIKDTSVAQAEGTSTSTCCA